MLRPPPRPTPFPYTTLFRSRPAEPRPPEGRSAEPTQPPRESPPAEPPPPADRAQPDSPPVSVEQPPPSQPDAGPPTQESSSDRKTTRLNSSHTSISYPLFSF